MTTATPIRKYAMVKGSGPGDWLLPGNAGKTLWRLRREDAADETAPGEWSVWRWIKALGGYIDAYDLEDWSQWDLEATGHRTREAAIDEALRLELPKPQPKHPADERPIGQLLAETAQAARGVRELLALRP